MRKLTNGQERCREVLRKLIDISSIFTMISIRIPSQNHLRPQSSSKYSFPTSKSQFKEFSLFRQKRNATKCPNGRQKGVQKPFGQINTCFWTVVLPLVLLFKEHLMQLSSTFHNMHALFLQKKNCKKSKLLLMLVTRAGNLNICSMLLP